MKHKQIRVTLNETSYNLLKKESMLHKLTISEVAGIKLNGYSIIPNKAE